jgi:hypothetical protein
MIMPAPHGRPVRDQGRMTKDGWGPENDAWFDVLTYRDEYGNPAGKDPMSLDLAVLTAAGHPPPPSSGAKAIIGRLRDIPVGDRTPEDGPWRLTNLRQICMGCAGDRALVRRCVCIECPIWPYRMGRNPHNPKRGHKPTFGARNPPVSCVSNPDEGVAGTET